MNYRSLTTMNHQLVEWLDVLPADLDLIVGIPRSGLLVANILALHLNLPLTDVDSFLEDKVFYAGPRGRNRILPNGSASRKNVLVVDDSVFTGKQMEIIKSSLEAADRPENVLYAAVYVIPEATDKVDFYCEVLPRPRCFEWNIMHHEIMGRSCVSLDGVLCREPLDTELENEASYAEYITSVTPKLIPSEPVHWLVTSRPEQYRAITEAWLQDNGIVYNKFVMSVGGERPKTRSNGYAQAKAELYLQSGAELFIENSFEQAYEISILTGKSVFCYSLREMVTPESEYLKTKINNQLYASKAQLKRYLNRVKST